LRGEPFRRADKHPLNTGLACVLVDNFKSFALKIKDPGSLHQIDFIARFDAEPFYDSLREDKAK
jgi:hypothetical protein